MQTLPPDLACGAFEAAPDAMIIVDESGNIRYANRQVWVLFGFSPNEIVGSSVEQLLPARYRDRHRQHRRQYNGNLRARPMGADLELFARGRDGREFPVEISLSPVGNAADALVAAAIRDVSDRKRIEQELRVSRAEAERARATADRANLAKSRFLATASHDLRQPLQVLALLNGALRRKVLDPNAVDALSQQAQAIAGMSQLVNALLDISKLESGAIKPDPTDFAVAALFADLRRDFAELAAAKGLQLQVEDAGANVRSDRSLVGQVLRNLVSNAIKYTQQGRVSLRCLRASGPMVRIEVLDTGIGIPSARIPYIYDEFYQVDDPDAETRDGYGLGLSIVRRIVALLGVKLDVRSEVGKGSAFTLELPAVDDVVVSPERLPIVGSMRPPRVSNAHVLLVEDEASVRSAARTLLEAEGYRVTAVMSGAEALKAADSERKIDLIVTDYHLGNLETGIDVVTALRERLEISAPVLVLTGDTSSAVKALTTDHDVRIASKPIDVGDLCTQIEELLASRPTAR